MLGRTGCFKAAVVIIVPHIVMITEGTYPYFGGGVSRWCHVLLTKLSQFKFTIVAIVPPKKVIEKFVLPQNLVQVKQVRIGDLSQFKGIDKAVVNGNQINEFIKENIEMHKAFISSDLASALKTTQQLFPKIQDDPVTFWRHKSGLKYLEERYKDINPEIPFYKWLVYWKNTHAMHLSLVVQKMPKGDLYHATNSGWAGVLGLLGAQRYGKPLLLTEHGLALRERGIAIERGEETPTHERLSLARISMRLNQLVYEAANLITVVCKANKDWLVQNIGIPEHKIVVTYNGVDIKTFKPVELPKMPSKIIATIARIFPLKDIKNLIKAASIVSRKKPELKFVVVGAPADREYYKECLNLVNDLNLQSVEFVGTSSNVIAWYNRMGIFVLPSISEGFPLTTIEAMSCGTPVIVTDVGGAAEPVKVGRRSCGLVVPPSNPSKLAEAILFLYDNLHYYRTLSLNARKLVETYFSETKFVQEYQKIYDELLSNMTDRNE
ncbi:MAG: GT4 family glycosyltransferase PelF [Candidatus Heimdallarchaeota archaeon]